MDDAQLPNAVDDYLKVRANKGLADSTLELDRWMASVINGSLGLRRVDTLSVQNVDRFLEAASLGHLTLGSEQRQPIGRTALRRIRSTLIGSLRNEMRQGLLNRNVADLSVLPADGSPASARRAITLEELHWLCDAAVGPTGVLVDLIGRNGLRPSEARAIRWKNVDLDHRMLTIDSQVNSNDDFTGPKTKKAHRTIRVDKVTAAKIRSWRVVQAEQREYAGPAWHEMDVVATTASGRPVQRNNLRRSVHVLCRRVGIDPPNLALRTPPHRYQHPGDYGALSLADRRLGRDLGANDHRGVPPQAVSNRSVDVTLPGRR